ncbi:MAG: methylated-DNA--[protein]-cysteine S-methyltransferase [Candidatus Bipolaricaulaceae bacterium]
MQWERVTTPWGDFSAAWEGDVLCQLRFPGPRPPGRWGRGCSLSAELGRQLTAYLEGQLRSFDLPLRAHGTAFQVQVWQALSRLPYGRTVTYGELAAALGRPRAGRAVGRAVGANPLPIIVPCHRVVGRDGRLGGYGPGLWWKARLLAVEGVEWRRGLGGPAGGPGRPAGPREGINPPTP